MLVHRTEASSAHTTNRNARQELGLDVHRGREGEGQNKIIGKCGLHIIIHVHVDLGQRNVFQCMTVSYTV